MRKNARIVNVPLEGTPGDVRLIGGTVMISNGERWLPYPETAKQLIELATDYGWGFEDGLPAGRTQCRMDTNKVPYIRLLIGRNPGHNAVFGSPSPGAQFHITWRAPNPETQPRKATWILGSVYAKTSIVPMWQKVPSIKEVKEMIRQEPVIVPSHLRVSA